MDERQFASIREGPYYSLILSALTSDTSQVKNLCTRLFPALLLLMKLRHILIQESYINIMEELGKYVLGLSRETEPIGERGSPLSALWKLDSGKPVVYSSPRKRPENQEQQRSKSQAQGRR